MKMTLGLDLGKDSLGWALIDNHANKIIGMGAKTISSEREVQRKVKRILRRSTKNESLRVKTSALAYPSLYRHHLQVIASIAERILPFLLHGLLAMLFVTSILMTVTSKDFQFWFNLSITILLGWIAVKNKN